MNIAVIFAGGVGSRMHSKDRPKQFLEMYNKPIIIHTLEYFENHSMIDAIVVVCIKDWIPYLNKLLYKFRIEKVKSVVPGGETGQLSIYNGLKSAKQIAKDEKSIVLIHDGVRPLINEKVISDNIQSVIKYGSAITTAKVKETILVVNEGTSVITYFSMFAQLGIPTYGIRACAKVRDNREKLSKVAQELLIINIIMSMISYMVLIILLFYVPKFRCEKELYVMLSFNIILTSIGMEWLYKALEQYTYITVRSVIFKFIALIFMFFLVHKQTDYVIYGGITIFAASASNILNLINAHKFINLKPVGNYNFRRHLKPVLIFFAMSCATTIYTNLDTVMLGFMTTDTDVGYYNAAVKIKVILVSVVTSLGTVLLPRASYYIQRGELKEFHRITRKALNFVFLMATPLFVYFIYFAKEGIFFLSGNNYVGSIIPMQVIMPTLLLIGITNILGIQILVPTGREKIVLYSEIVGAVVDVIINALLIPVYASTGAAIGTLVAEFAVFVVQFYALKDEILNTFRQIHYIKILIALSVGSIVSLWVKILNLECFFSLVISSLLFFGAYGFVLLILKEELFVEIFNTIKNKII